MPSSQQSHNSATASNLSNLLYRDLLNHNIVNIANELVNQYGSSEMRRTNVVLNLWHRNWLSRRVNDTHDQQNRAFSHPLNFWLLAKLFVVLHFFRHCISDTSENMELQNPEMLAFLSEDESIVGKIRSQVQIIIWLSRIRQGQGMKPSSTRSFLSQVISVE